jgi:LMBR1 domain-containing protein 1
MYLFWQIMFMAILFWLVFLIPFSVFFYEEDDGVLLGNEPKSRVCIALKYELMVLFIVAVIFTLCYLFLSTTYIPVEQYSGTPSAGQATTLYSFPTDGMFSINQFEDITTQEVTNAKSSSTSSQSGTVPLRLSAPVFFIGLMAFIGWFFFAIFGGIGLPALPMDFILAFKYRTRHMVCACGVFSVHESQFHFLYCYS